MALSFSAGDSRIEREEGGGAIADLSKTATAEVFGIDGKTAFSIRS
jgi:hypothetical protein